MTPDALAAQNLPLVVLAALWTIPWKGWALWKAARAGSKPWFVALLIVNTLGALEILYIFYFSKRTTPGASGTPKTTA